MDNIRNSTTALGGLVWHFYDLILGLGNQCFHPRASSTLNIALEQPREEISEINSKKCGHILITYMRATDLACGLRRLPAGFYVAVEFDGITAKTSNKTVSIGKDIAEWDEEIILLSTQPSVISFEIYASFEQDHRFGSGELLGRFEISVGEIFHRNEPLEPIRFFGSRNEPLSTCLSLEIIAKRRNCDGSECQTRPEVTRKSELEGLTDEGHRALLCFSQDQDRAYLDKAIWCFQQVHNSCPVDHPNRSAASFNLASAKFIHCQVISHNFDLDLPIALYREALHLRTTGHLDHITTALELGFALLVRFQRRGYEMDRMEATDLLGKVVELAPADSHTYRAGWLTLEMANVTISLQERDSETSHDPHSIGLEDRTQAVPRASSHWDPRHPRVLAQLGGLLYRRFEENGDLADIHEAISMLDEAAQLVPDSHADMPGFLNNLGMLLERRFERLGDTADMERSILVLEKALYLTPDGQPDKPHRLNNLGNSLLSRFQCLGGVTDLAKSVSIKEQAVRLTPDGHQDKPNLLNDLGNSLFRRFDRLGDIADISKSISMKEEAVRLTPDGHPERPGLLNDLGISLLRRFERLGDVADLTKSISMEEEAVCLTPDGHLDKPTRLINLGISLLSRFEHLGNILDVMKSVSMFEEAISLTPDGHPDKPSQLSNLGNSLFRRFERLGDLTDIKKSVLMFEEAVRLSPDGHPDKPRRLNNLGNALFRCFERLGDIADMEKSVSVRGEAIHLTPDGHPDKPSLLNNLGTSLTRCFERLDDVAVITKSISMLEEAIHLIPDGHATKPTLLNNLGMSLFRRFERLGDVADTTNSVRMNEEAIRLTPDDHPNKPHRLNNLGNILSRRFERLGDVTDIMKSVSIKEEAVCLIPDNHPDKPSLLSDLGNSLLSRFQRFGDIADITKSISMNEEAVHLTPDNHPDKPTRLNNLGVSLLNRFEHLGDVADITKSISMNEEAIHLTPDGHPDKPIRLNSLGVSLLSRFERLGDVADITKSVSMEEEAVRLTPDGHPDKPRQLNNLGVSLLSRFERLGNVADITKSVSMKEEAVRLIPYGHPSRPSLLSDLGNSLLSRFERLGDVADITKSVSMKEEAVRLAPDGHPDKPTLLNNLGNSLLSRFQRLGDIADITKSVSMKEEAIRLTPDGHPDIPGRLNNLGISLSHRFERLGDVADIAKSVSVFEKAVRLTPDGHPDKSSRLNNLGNSLLSRLELGDIADITKMVSIFEEAVRLTPDGHPAKASRFDSLGHSLFRRFECLSDAADIRESVLMEEEAVRLTPDGHPDKPSRLNNLGKSLSRRFELFDNIADIMKSISMFEEAVRLTPDGHPDKPSRLNNLGNSLLNRFERLGDVVDSTKSVLNFEEAVRLTPDGHPHKPAWLYNLGNSFISRFKRLHDSSCLSVATSYFSTAAQSSVGPASVRFKAARSWIWSVEVEGNSQTLLDAYTIALGLLPQLAWIGLPLTERHRVLIDAADVARGAAAAALEAGYSDMAVEWLEQGRSIVWTQFLQLRTPVDILRVTHPGLADEFEQTSKQLEGASIRDHVPSTEVLGSDPWSQEEVVQKHLTLTLRRQKLLDDIRSLPGFDRFLLPKTIGQLTALAVSGPVVYLNPSKRRCDALIVMVGQSNVVHVPLHGITYAHVQRMHRLLLNHDCTTVSTDDILLLSPSSKRDATTQTPIQAIHDREGRLRIMEVPFDRFQLVLAFLWREVVNPVLKTLGLSTPSATLDKMTRILWCPTGHFAFLPIHAAGLYDGSPTSPKLSDFAISSYIPTLGSLTPSTEQDASDHTSTIHLLTVPQPADDGQSRLNNVKKEIDHIRALSAKSQFITLQESDGTIDDVIGKMVHAGWVHFACHGVQDPFRPLDSGLCLANQRRLRLSDIIKLSRKPGGLAFLSACQTAKGDEKLSEESVHLAAGMLLAGYGCVIATMWSIMDNDAPRVARDVYQYLLRDGKVPDSAEAAEALHHAVVRLRDEDKVPFSSWVPFIHVGR